MPMRGLQLASVPAPQMRTVMSVGASDSACVPGAPSLGISNSCRRSADIVRCLLRKSYPLHRHLHAALYPSAHSHSKHHVASSSFQHRFRDAHAPANCRPRRSRGDVWVSSPLQRPASLRPAASGLLLRPKQPLHRPVMHRTRTHHVYTQARAQMHRNTNNVSRSTATCDVVCVRVMNIFSQGKKTIARTHCRYGLGKRPARTASPTARRRGRGRILFISR